MNIQKLAETHVQDFIFNHGKEDEDKLVLKYKEILGVPSSWIAGQIKARRKSAYKLPLFHKTKGIIYPPSLNLEQSSSEATARFKDRIVAGWISTRRNFCDLTGGFGVDSFFLSSLFDHCDFIEPLQELVNVAQHNHHLLGATNIQYHVTDAVGFLIDATKRYDLLFIDPSRRDASNKKVFRFSDCVPDLVDLQSELDVHTDRVMIKAAPLLDIQLGIKDLEHVSRVVVLAVDNECKELLFLCEKEFGGEPRIECYNVDNAFKTNDAPVAFTFKFSEERSLTVPFSPPKRFIYEPDASIMKSGGFKSIAAAFDLSKLQANTHLYTSDDLVTAFPGRIFRVEEIVKPGKKLRERFPGGKANIVLRNYPSTVEDLKKKTGLTDGGELYLIGCSGVNDKWTFVASRLK